MTVDFQRLGERKQIICAIWTGIPTLSDAKTLMIETKKAAAEVNRPGQINLIPVGVIKAEKLPDEETRRYMDDNSKPLLEIVKRMYYVNLLSGFLGSRIFSNMTDQLLRWGTARKIRIVRSFDEALEAMQNDPDEPNLLQEPRQQILIQARRLKIPGT